LSASQAAKTNGMKFETSKAGRWHQRWQYKSFEPVLVNHDWTWEDPSIHVLLESANRALGELNAFSLIVPDINLFIHTHPGEFRTTQNWIGGSGLADAGHRAD
jgi:hypothetical protein